MKIGSLFSGIAGLEMGLVAAGLGEVVWQVECEPFCLSVLEKHWPEAKRYTDVREVGKHNLESVDVICGGFPCQDLSLAGRGAGLAGARSGLWFEYLRIVREIRPRYVVVENVPALRKRGLGQVLGGLAEERYNALWFNLRASTVDAPHRRERIFILAWNTDLVGGDLADPVREYLRGVAGSLRREEGANEGEGVQRQRCREAPRDRGEAEVDRGLWPTASARESGITAERLVDRNGNPPETLEQRLYDKFSGKVVSDGLIQAVKIASMWPTPTTNGDAGSRNTPESHAVKASEPEYSGNSEAVKQAWEQRNWPTAAASDVKGPCGSPTRRPPCDDDLPLAVQRNWPTAAAADGVGGAGQGATVQGGLNLRTAVSKEWDTPSVADGTGGHVSRSGDRKGELLLGGQARVGSEGNGRLNPDWVETLQGFPVGWTDPEKGPLPHAIPDRWPSRPGEAQYSWEPPRTTSGCTKRPARLKALGNSVVPAVAYVVGTILKFLIIGDEA